MFLAFEVLILKFWLFDLEVLERSAEWDSDTAETERFCA
jgi:hypothetical protein